MKKPKSDVLLDDRDFPMSLGRKCLFQATGIDIAEGRQKPIIAIVNSQTEINPGHMHLGSWPQRVKEGVHAAGGIPSSSTCPPPATVLTEGHEGMRFVLPQRDLIADIVETHVRSMMYDGMVIIASCDKIIPGMLMAAARLDLPAIFITGGPRRLGHPLHERRSRGVWTAPTTTTRGTSSRRPPRNLRRLRAHGDRQYLPVPHRGAGPVPARLGQHPCVPCRQAALRPNDRQAHRGDGGGRLTARKILTPQAIENAIMVDLAIGGSTNATLHLPALAHEIGIDLPLSPFNEFSKRIPDPLRHSPNGPHGVIDLYVAGGVPAVMRRLADDLHLDALTVAGKTIGDVVMGGAVRDEDVIPDKAKAYLAGRRHGRPHGEPGAGGRRGEADRPSRRTCSSSPARRASSSPSTTA